MRPTLPSVVPSPHDLLREEESVLLGGVWELLQQSGQRGRLDAAGLHQSEIDRLTVDIFRVISAVVNANFARVADGLV